jgi:Transposase DDE domain group 1
MSSGKEVIGVHPEGEQELRVGGTGDWAGTLDTYAGTVHAKWDEEAAVTPFGQMIFFIEFLKTAGLWDAFVKDCPLTWASHNAPGKADVLGTILLSVLAGHRRYAHMTALRFDGVNPQLLGMSKVCSEDSVRRAFQDVEEAACTEWLTRHLQVSYEPLLKEPWILDVDTTVKPLYGYQEGAKNGYNPGKPGRPSHAYHTYFAANIRLVLDVEVQPGNQTASSFAQPELWKFLGRLPAEEQPDFIRGDCGWGTDRMMREAEERKVRYLLKLKQSTRVKQLVKQVFSSEDWTTAGQGWKGVEAELKLTGWSHPRRVIVLRRRLRGELALAEKKRLAGTTTQEQLALGFVETTGDGLLYEYAVLVTSLPDEILTIAQHYRDRADAENNFDELKNQWGWSGFTTHDLKRCQIMARLIALIYNWWSLFTRLAIPEKHAEAITSRPLLLNAVGKQTLHSGQTTVTLTSLHAKAPQMQTALRTVSAFLATIRHAAEQLTYPQKWLLILSRIFRHLLKGRPLKRPPSFLQPA